LSEDIKEKVQKWIDGLSEKERTRLYKILVKAIAKDAKARQKRRDEFDAD
jgi:hypothetical protein